MKKIALAAAMGAAMLLSGCASGTAGAPDPVGTWGVAEEGKPQLVLEEGGTLHGTDGCNRLVGTWSEADGKVVFGPLAGTRMFCEGVDTWLSDAKSAKVVSGSLEIFDVKDAAIGTLKHAE